MRPTRRVGLTVAAGMLVALAAAGSTSAQGPAESVPEDAWRPGYGDRSIAFAIPESGRGSMALWWHRTGGRAVGLELGFSGNVGLLTGGATADRLNTRASLYLGPAIKRYTGDIGPVAPYFITGLGLAGSFGYDAVDDPGIDPRTTWGAGVYLRLGGGADWFVAERVSLGGHVGGKVAYQFQPGRAAGDPDRHSLGLSTFTGGLTLHIYF